jgi:aminoglycoside 2''-phosphotransferase
MSECLPEYSTDNIMHPDWRKVEHENAGLSVRTTRLIGEGWNSRAYLINDELVVRCPKHAEHWEELEQEIAFLTFTADKLPLPVPRYLQAARHSSAAPHGYAIYKYLPGGSMDLSGLTNKKRDAAATALAGFLRALHALQLGPGSGIVLPHVDARLIAEQYFARAASDIVPKVTHQAAGALLRVFEMHLAEPRNFSFKPVLLHADLSRDHVLMEDGVVTGVIDFGDVNWGDPDYDFMYLFVEFGLAFVEAVARRYGHLDLRWLRAKLRYFAIVDQIDTILNGQGFATEGEETTAWLRLEQLLKCDQVPAEGHGSWGMTLV